MLKRVLAAAKTIYLQHRSRDRVLRLAQGQRTLQAIAESTYQGVCPAYDVDQTLQSISFLHPMVEHMRELGWGVYSFDQEGGPRSV